MVKAATVTTLNRFDNHQQFYKQNGAGERNRTVILSMGNSGNNHYTTPAADIIQHHQRQYNASTARAFLFIDSFIMAHCTTYRKPLNPSATQVHTKRTLSAT